MGIYEGGLKAETALFGGKVNFILAFGAEYLFNNIKI